MLLGQITNFVISVNVQTNVCVKLTLKVKCVEVFKRINNAIMTEIYIYVFVWQLSSGWGRAICPVMGDVGTKEYALAQYVVDTAYIYSSPCAILFCPIMQYNSAILC